MLRGTFPIIDLERFESNDSATRRDAIRELDEACQHIGFLIIRNHGVSASVSQAAPAAKQPIQPLIVLGLFAL